MALASGTDFAGYTVVRMLRSSATGELYLAERANLPGWQALKMLPFALWADGEFRARFVRETASVASLHHPNIVAVHERGEFDEKLWFAMDYIDASDVAALMADRFPAMLAVGEALGLITAAAAGLDFAHQRGVLHRDVRPANLLLPAPGVNAPRIMLSDFGLQRPSGEEAYAAPEESTGAAADGRADQYALAATAMHLFTGAAPAGPNPPRLSDLRPDLARMDEVLSRALADDPADRFGSCGEFARALIRAAGIADRSSDAPETSAEAIEPAYVVDYPAYAWPEDSAGAQHAVREPGIATPAPRGMFPGSATGSMVRRRDASSSGTRKARTFGPRRMVIGGAAALSLAGLFAAGITVGRQIDASASYASGPVSSASSTLSTFSARPAAPPPLDGTYRIEVQRSRQTFNGRPTPQPPDVETWWAIRSSCTPTRCFAAATLLSDSDHTQERSPDVHPLLLEFIDGLWRSRAETTKFPCIGPTGQASAQTTAQVLTLAPQPAGDLVGEMAVTVKSNECGQLGGLIQIPAVATRGGDVPPAVKVPDPVLTPVATPETTVATETPTTRASGPGP